MNEAEILEMMYGKPTQKPVEKYPLTDISFDSAKNVFVEVSVAGFTKCELNVEIKDKQLIIEGVSFEDEDSDLEYVQRNISKRSFKRVVALAEEYVNGEFYADLEDGILTISITPKTPPSTTIEIN